MTVYRTSGTLTGTILPENVATAQQYLAVDEMPEYVSANAELVGVLTWIKWDLSANGHDYTITAVTSRDLTDDELKRLSAECSGQNSDGLGEGFEQQSFAELGGEEAVDCVNCDGTGEVPGGDEEEDEQIACPNCDGAGYFDEENWGMISFDWKTNELPWTRIG